MITVEPRESGTNPMREARDAENAERTRTAASELATRIAEAVKAGRSAGSVLVGTDVVVAKDAWGTAFVVLDGSEQGSGGIAQIVSSGPDAVIGSEDDISFVVTSEGELRERLRREGRSAGGGRRGRSGG